MKAMMCRIAVILVLLGVLAVWSPARAAEMTCPTPVPVTIDIKPGSYPNTINLLAQGVVPVAVITTPDFDASQFIPAMAHLTDADTPMTDGCSGAMAVRWAWEDVNGDGKPDLVFFFNVQDLSFTSETTAATLMAHGSYGTTTVHILGTDSVIVRP